MGISFRFRALQSISKPNKKRGRHLWETHLQEALPGEIEHLKRQETIKINKETNQIKLREETRQKADRARPGPRKVGRAELEVGRADLAASWPEFARFRRFE